MKKEIAEYLNYKGYNDISVGSFVRPFEFAQLKNKNGEKIGKEFILGPSTDAKCTGQNIENFIYLGTPWTGVAKWNGIIRFSS